MLFLNVEVEVEHEAENLSLILLTVFLQMLLLVAEKNMMKRQFVTIVLCVSQIAE